MKTSPSLGEDIYKGITNKGLLSRIFKELRINKENITQFKKKKNRQRVWLGNLQSSTALELREIQAKAAVCYNFLPISLIKL